MLFSAVSILSFASTLVVAVELVDPLKSRFGARFCLTDTTSWIREVNTTLLVPAVPSPAVDQLALWPGLEVEGGGLTQALVRSLADPR